MIYSCACLRFAFYSVEDSGSICWRNMALDGPSIGAVAYLMPVPSPEQTAPRFRPMPKLRTFSRGFVIRQAGFVSWFVS